MRSPRHQETSAIRPVNPFRDLNSIADLIEVCFTSHMDDEGKDYVRYLRNQANSQGSIFWPFNVMDGPALPVQGYVWEENGRIIGNLTLIPCVIGGKPCSLIANVAVLPDFRRRGIARQLTQTALANLRQRGAPAAWLQVRDDNDPAFNLYLSLGFEERTRRTTWVSNPEPMPGSVVAPSISITPRIPADWPLQSTWLKTTYPPEIAWNLTFNLGRLKPGFWQDVQRLLYGTHIIHRAARLKGQLIGAVSWEATKNHYTSIWLAANHDFEDLAVSSLLSELRHQNLFNRKWMVNYPAGSAVNAFKQAGFSRLNTLIWMKIPLGEPVRKMELSA